MKFWYWYFILGLQKVVSLQGLRKNFTNTTASYSCRLSTFSTIRKLCCIQDKINVPLKSLTIWKIFFLRLEWSVCKEDSKSCILPFWLFICSYEYDEFLEEIYSFLFSVSSIIYIYFIYSITYTVILLHILISS